MYRKALAMEHERIAQETFIGRVGNLPVVNSAWTQACGVYQKTKERNSFLNATCRVAESGVGLIATTTKPIVDRYQPQIKQVDAFACDKLTWVEETYPVITKPTDEVIKEGREKCETLLKPVTDRYNHYKDAYNGMVNRNKERVEGTVQMVKDLGQKSIDSPYGKFVLEKVDEALALSESYVEKYLPESEELEDYEENGEEEHPGEASTLTRVTTLSTKLRQRMYKRAMRDLKQLQVRSHETLERLHFTVDLIQYAKAGYGNAKDVAEEKYELVHRKVVDTWGKITEEREDGSEESNPETLEGKTIAVARKLTCQVRQSVTVITGYLPETYQPDAVRERLLHARLYSEELYHSFREAHKFEDLPSWALSQAKEKMSYLQDTVSFLAETFLITPISWLVPARSEPLEMVPITAKDMKSAVTSEAKPGVTTGNQ